MLCSTRSLMRKFLVVTTLVLATITTQAVRGDELADLRAKADKGDAVAQFELARKFASGQNVPKDDQAALQLFLKAAKQGHTKAEVSLGSIYAHGFGVPVDWAASIQWYRRAAAKGDTTALHNLGLDYTHGHGVEKDAKLAARWLRLAAEQGHARGQYNLGELYEKGSGVAKSDLEAFVWYTLASQHENQLHIFGEAKEKEVIVKRDQAQQRLSAAEVAEGQRRIAATTALVALHPRKFGVPPGVGATRGFYLWRKFDPQTRQAEVSHEGTGEVYQTRVLPWVTTYRHLTYGAAPEELLPGERVNVFFSPDEHHKRGYVVHFQDEICQMHGHGHAWEVKAVTANGRGFSGQVMAGDKPLDSRMVSFVLDKDCQVWREGKLSAEAGLKVGERVFMTATYASPQLPQVVLLSDAASLDAIKKLEQQRVQERVRRDGLGGTIELLEAPAVQVCLFSNYWSQASQLKQDQPVRLQLADDQQRPTGASVTARVLVQKNRGTYGSGVNDVVLKLDRAEDAAVVELWMQRQIVRLIPQ